MNSILGVFGPWQIIFLLLILGLIITIVLVIVRLTVGKSNSIVINNKVSDPENNKVDRITSLERLQKLRDSGVLSEEEFMIEKNKIID